MSRRVISALLLAAFAAACSSPTGPSTASAKKECPVIVTSTC